MLIDESVQAAAEQLRKEAPLYAIVNNAGTWSMENPDLTVEVNVLGAKRVIEACKDLVQEKGRIIYTGSGAASMYVGGGRGGVVPVEERKQVLMNPHVTWEQLESILQRESAERYGAGDDAKSGAAVAYGVSKAVATAYHFIVQRENPTLVVSTCSPGFILTPLTVNAGMTPKLTPEQGTVSLLKLLFEDLEQPAWIYYGSDALRSPLDTMRDPGTPEYNPPVNWWK